MCIGNSCKKIVVLCYQIISTDLTDGLCSCTQELAVLTRYVRIYTRAWIEIVTHRLTLDEKMIWRILDKTTFFITVPRQIESLCHFHCLIHLCLCSSRTSSLLTTQQKFTKLHIDVSWILELVKKYSQAHMLQNRGHIICNVNNI